jgi:hypothetical protein
MHMSTVPGGIAQTRIVEGRNAIQV